MDINSLGGNHNGIIISKSVCIGWFCHWRWFSNWFISVGLIEAVPIIAAVIAIVLVFANPLVDLLK